MQEEMRHFLTLYTQTFPQREHTHIVTCTNISTGWEGDLFCINLEYEEEGARGSEEVILKLYYGPSGARKAQRESRSLQQCRLMGYPVPRVLFSALEDSPFGQAGVAMEKIQGHPAAHVFDRSSQEHQRALVAQCCQRYVDLHALNWKSYLPHPKHYQKEDIMPFFVALAKDASDQQLPGFFEPVIEWLQRRSQEVSSSHLSLVHGDFHLHNVIVRDDGTLVVIDWTGTHLSDYRFDLGWTLLLLRTQHSESLATMLLEEYERLACHRIEQLDFFEAMACFKRLFEITVSLKSGTTALGIKPEAEKDMRQQINHIRAVYAQLQKRTDCSLPEIEQLILTLG